MFNLKKIVQKKIIRLKNSKNVFKLNYIRHKFFGEKHSGELGLNFDNKPTRNEIIQNTILRKNYQSYLEIGCFKNELFDFIKCKNKVGVDPQSGGTIRKTSDDFFRSNNLLFDCIFIDGLHVYEQARKDINNSLKYLNEGGVIFIHDCLPNNIYDQAIPRSQFNWNGDVWKAIVECRSNEDVDTYTCYADQGIGIILKRKNRDKLDIKINNFSKLKFSDYFQNYNNFMNIVNYDDLENLF